MSTEIRLSREMRLIDITMIGVGAMIGAGIFVLTGIAAGVAGPALMLAFLLNGLVALLTAMSYAELGSAVHGAGGGYLWIKRALPDPSGFLAGWMDWFAHAVACSLYALGFGAYFREVLHVVGITDFTLPMFPIEVWLGVGACAVFAYINYRGASETGKAGNVVTVGKVAIIGVFIFAGLWAMANRAGWQGSFSPFLTEGWGGVFGAMGLTFIAFEGYEIIAQTSEEVENPRKNVPRAVFLSLAIVIPIYLLVALVAVGAVTPPPGVPVTEYLAVEKETALVTAADQFFIGGGLMILVGGLLSTLSALNATVYSSSRVALAMARDASLPPVITRVHSVRATPHVAILLSAALIIGMAIALPIEEVAAAASVMFLLIFAGVNVALIRLRKMEPELDRGFRVPWTPFLPVLAIASMSFVAVFMFVQYPLAWIAAGGWIVTGTVMYAIYSRTREQAFIEREEWMGRIERREYRVLVAVSSPKTIETLMEAAIAIARPHGGEIVVLTVAEVPEGEALLTGKRMVRQLEPVLQHATRYAREHGVEARSVVKIAHRISHGIAQTAREESCNFLIIGSAYQQSVIERLVVSIVERVLKDAPCRVGIVYGQIRRDAIRQVVVPVTKSRNAQLAAELGPAFGASYEVPIRAVTVIERATAPAETDAIVAGARATLEAAHLDVDLEVLRRRDAVRGLIGAFRGGDLILVGAPKGVTAPLIGETIPMEIVRRRHNPVVVVREVDERVRRFERVFFRRSYSENADHYDRTPS